MELKRSKPAAFEILKNALKELKGIEGKVGWFESAKYENGTPVAYAAALNELGHGPTPPRPFMRPTASANKDKWAQTAAQGAKMTFQGLSTATEVMGMLTEQAEGDVSKTIANLHSPALSPITIELRAMKKRDPGLKITGATVGIAAARVRQPGYTTPDVSVKPLIDSGLAIATLTHTVEKTA